MWFSVFKLWLSSVTTDDRHRPFALHLKYGSIDFNSICIRHDRHPKWNKRKRKFSCFLLLSILRLPYLRSRSRSQVARGMIKCEGTQTWIAIASKTNRAAIQWNVEFAEIAVLRLNASLAFSVCLHLILISFEWSRIVSAGSTRTNSIIIISHVWSKLILIYPNDWLKFSVCVQHAKMPLCVLCCAVYRMVCRIVAIFRALSTTSGRAHLINLVWMCVRLSL